MNKIIYVVTSGEYSDYRLRSMFSTKELDNSNFYEVSYKNRNTTICEKLESPVNLLESGDTSQQIIIGNEYLNNNIKYSYTNNLMSR